MDDYTASTYGDRIADVYYRWFRQGLAPAEQTVEALARLAGNGPVLELAIGTGRIALPLAARGLRVQGIDISGATVARLREKLDGTDIPVTIGDLADVAVEGLFSLVYVVFNTFWALLTQEDQTRCFRNVATHLTEDGAFVIEAFVPDPARFDRGQRTSTSWVDTHTVTLEASRHDPVNQRVDSQHVVIREDGIKLYPVSIRYAHLRELDLMAKLARMRLRDRWAGWNGELFTEDSEMHVSVYELATSG